MNFNSFAFLLFLPTVVGIYWMLKGRMRRIWLLMASYFFYMYANPALIVLLLISTFVDYFCSNGIEKYRESPNVMKLLLIVSMAVNLGLLFTFKYFDFFAQNINLLCQLAGFAYRVPELGLILPVGISFYTFQTMSYTIDVYRGDFHAEKDPVTFALYVTYFPQLVAGPIETPSHLLPQLNREKDFSWDCFVRGMRIMLRGFFKKCVVADVCAVFADRIFSDYGSYGGLSISAGALVFLFQMYGDFSGYSDIAFGTAQMMGVELSRNFDRPFVSQSYTEFFRRWHITLNRWFTSYVYIPLGGSRRGTAIRLRNTFIVFLLCGLWHGASWTYVLWGLYAACFISAEELFHKATGTRFSDIKKDSRVMCAVRIALMFLTYIPSAIFFRSTTVSDSLAMIGRLFVPGRLAFSGADVSLVAAIGAGIFSMIVLDRMGVEQRENEWNEAAVDTLLILIVAISWIALLSGGDKSSFAYFQF